MQNALNEAKRCQEAKKRNDARVAVYCNETQWWLRGGETQVRKKNKKKAAAKGAEQKLTELDTAEHESEIGVQVSMRKSNIVK